ncbi:Holliday junction resolvase RuvX [Nakamurella flavida]|uniref:Holliday junction resolvase RuvX n=1 Tax=Nakamurella flavida TaxID=363630 RepID=UPI0030B8E7EE
MRLGIDVGTVRVGVARSDPLGMLAVPVATLKRDVGKGTDLDEIVRLVEEHEVVEVVIGLPRTLRGDSGPAVTAVRAYADALTARLTTAGRGIPLEFVDERLTSVIANRGLADRGMSAKARRSVVDQVAAVSILQNRLDTLARASS